jgi:trehalose-6-phosphate synthase
MSQTKLADMKRRFDITTKFIGLGVDRLDYTKGILERLKAIELFLETYSSYMQNFTFIQIAPPSRSQIETYKEFDKEVTAEAQRINAKFKRESWKPIILLKQHFNHEDLKIFYAMADCCLVTSLHDGMNLVAKEYIAARHDEKGVLILSQFTGASRELSEALIVNPYNTFEMAESINTALTMSSLEQTRRMKKMREKLKNNNVYRWSADILKALVSIGS